MRTLKAFLLILTSSLAVAQESVQPATQAEVNAGVRRDKYVSPATLAGWTGGSGSGSFVAKTGDTMTGPLTNNFGYYGDGGGLTNLQVSAITIFTNMPTRIVTTNFIVGGPNQSIGTPDEFHAVLMGGDSNTLQSGASGFIGTAIESLIGYGSQWSFIGSGAQNIIGTTNEMSVIVGGLQNQIGDDSGGAFIGGGSGNFAAGDYATILGGSANKATGVSSMAFGAYATSEHDGAVVWNLGTSLADAQFNPTTSEAAGQFLVRAPGGFKINGALDVSEGITQDGVPIGAPIVQELCSTFNGMWIDFPANVGYIQKITTVLPYSPPTFTVTLTNMPTDSTRLAEINLILIGSTNACGFTSTNTSLDLVFGSALAADGVTWQWIGDGPPATLEANQVYFFHLWAWPGSTNIYASYETGWTTPTGDGGTGSVTSVGLQMPAQFSVSNTPITGSGTLGVSWQNQSANQVLAGPASGGPGQPTFRALVEADIPQLSYVAKTGDTMTGPLTNHFGYHGDGGGLTNLQADAISGTIPDARISNNIVRTNNIDAVSLLNDSNRVRGVFTAIAGTNGVVTLRRANGTFTNFFGATDTARGAALLAALNAAGSGDVVHLGPGVFDLAGGNATLGTNVSLIGQGRGQTIIVNVTESDCPLTLTRDNTISSVTLSNSTANGDYVGVRNITSDYGRVVFDDVAIYGYSGMTLQGNGSMEMRHSYVYGSSDSLVFAGPSFTIALYDSVFECVGTGRSLNIVTASSTAIIKDCVFKKSGEASSAFAFMAQSTSRASLFNCTWEVDDGSLHVMNMGDGTLTLDATCNFDAEKVSGAFVRAKSYGHSPSEGFLQLMRDGVLDAENMTGTIPDARLSTNVLLATNSLTRNVRFVDAGSGSDNNDGSVVNPWATLTHAQTQTPIGWTIAVLPGTYAGDVTNNSVNYFLHPGASASFAFVHAGTNAISGGGNIEISSTTNDLSISCFIQAKAVTAAPSMSVGAETDLTIHADVVSGLWQPTQTSGTNVVRIVCRKFDGQVTGNTGSGLVGMTLTATESIRMLKGGFNYGSVITAPVLYAVPPTPFFTDTGMPFVWNVGLTRGWTNSVLWPSGMTFVGNPIFDLGGFSISAPNATGIYTVR